MARYLREWMLSTPTATARTAVPLTYGWLLEARTCRTVRRTLVAALGLRVSLTKDGTYHAHVTVDGKRHERKFKYIGDAAEWVRATREEIHDDRFLRHR